MAPAPKEVTKPPKPPTGNDGDGDGNNGTGDGNGTNHTPTPGNDFGAYGLGGNTGDQDADPNIDPDEPGVGLNGE